MKSNFEMFYKDLHLNLFFQSKGIVWFNVPQCCLQQYTGFMQEGSIFKKKMLVNIEIEKYHLSWISFWRNPFITIAHKESMLHLGNPGKFIWNFPGRACSF